MSRPAHRRHEMYRPVHRRCEMWRVGRWAGGQAGGRAGGRADGRADGRAGGRAPLLNVEWCCWCCCSPSHNHPKCVFAALCIVISGERVEFDPQTF